MAIDGHNPVKLDMDFIVVNANNLEQFLNGEIAFSDKMKRQLLSFIPQSTIAIVMVRDKEVAGWGFVQKANLSKYAGYDYMIPKGTHLLKNLFVEPDFRGQSIGKDINLARVNSIPDHILPTVFVVPSNKYAIRNLEMYGFSKQVYVKDYLWFNKYHKRSLRVIGENDIAKVIISGFKDA
ncbi:hypothetical protein [uncultured Winogradskyella sp.]|uniref:hypothetical protein n=1 Tax=uncultured Winogradskyella sp. TaxID=395353 RepID=UPI0026233E20|nr:hypothetical protein [uncultured Winogradskyella sp.]